MGNQNSQIEEGVVGHERLGLIRIIENNLDPSLSDTGSKELMVLSNRTIDKSDFSKWQDYIRLYRLHTIKEILLLPIGHEIKSGGYCGSSCIMDV